MKEELEKNRPLDSMDEIAYFELRDKNEALKKEIALQKERTQAAELETSLVKAVGMNSPEMIKVKKEAAELKELLKSRDYTRQHDYKFLIEENKELREEINNLKHNKEKRINKAREAGF
jgi:hypothetical protein